MLFSCTIGQLINRLLAKLAVSDQISLEQLWQAAAAHSANPDLDSLQKNVVWRALMANSEPLLVQIHARNESIEVDPALTYGDLLLRALELEVVLRPTEECQCRYLTNTDDYHVLKASLGEFPFGLLIVIARHGTEGILNSDLARELGQDIRSIRLRLQKLEAAQLIVCRNVYVNKKHTTHSIHVKFAGENVRLTDLEDDEESIATTRDVKKMKAMIILALKKAPNQLRGFSDLKKEFKLDESRLASKFFRSVCLKIHQQGFIEKLHVELPETKQRVYAIQFVKDLPTDISNVQDWGDDLRDIDTNEKDGFDDSDLDDDTNNTVQAPEIPIWNKVFPPFHQIFAHIHGSASNGVTSGEICKNLFGAAEYRPYTRLYELLPTYLSNLKTLKSFKKYSEPYDEYSVSKLYENEGKVRFYKYFATSYCTEKKPLPKTYKFIVKPSKLSLAELQKELCGKKNVMSNDALRERKRRMFLILGSDSVPASPGPVKRQKREKREKLPKWATENDDLDADLDTVDVALAAQGRSSRKRRAAPKSFALLYDDDAMDVEKDSGDEYAPVLGEEEEDNDEHIQENVQSAVLPSSPQNQATVLEELDELSALKETPTLSAHDIPTFVVAVKQEKRKRPALGVVKSEGSLKSIIRRDHLLNIIREEGGATFKNASLCRKLDERLEASTATDLKTLGRDIALLTKSGVLETQKVVVEVDEKKHEKRILVLTSVSERPSHEVIEQITRAYADRLSRRELKVFQKRLIQSDMKLYVEAPASAEKGRRGKGRLPALDDAGGRFSKDSKGTSSENNVNDADLNVLAKIKRVKRPRKVVQSSSSSVAPTAFSPKRPRRNIQLEKADATTLYRCVVILKAFSREAIDFDEIASLLGDMDGQILRQKWGTLRRLFGGAGAVSKGVETFQHMVLQGVEEALISEQDLVECDLLFFLEFWRNFDTATEFSVADEMPLFASFAANNDAYTLKSTCSSETVTCLADKIEDLSMRQKEFVLGQAHFEHIQNRVPAPKPNDELKSILKLIFASGEEKFDVSMVKIVLDKYDDKAVRAATDSLTHDRLILYIVRDDAKKFVMGERFKAALVLKNLGPKLFHLATLFKETLADISAAGKGMLLSQGIQPGEMAALLELISDGLAEVTRIDRTFKFESYESRLVDKAQIGCDIVVQVSPERARSVRPTAASVPLRGPCQPLWVDLLANFNKELWTKIIISVLSQVVFRPGITDHSVQDRMQAVLNYAEYCDAIGWLVESGCVRRTAFGGYVASNCWQYILG